MLLPQVESQDHNGIQNHEGSLRKVGMMTFEPVSHTTDVDHQMLRDIFELLAERGRIKREANQALSENEETGSTNLLRDLTHEQKKKILGL